MEVHDVLVAVDGVPVSLVEKGFQFETLYNEVFYTNALILLVKIMLCSNLYCINVFS